MGGCSLNFVDIADVLGHDMLRGVITAIDVSDDTCSVDVDGRTLTKIPLFFNGGLNTTPRLLPSGYYSVTGAAAFFEVNDKVIVMVGRGAYAAENFVLGFVDGKKAPSYLVDFKRIYVLQSSYVNASWVKHYAPDQVLVQPVWTSPSAGPYVYPSFSVPSDGTLPKDWFLRIPPNPPEYNTMYNILYVESPPTGYYMTYDWTTGDPIRPSPLGKEYTFKSVIAVPEIVPGYTPKLYADLGYFVVSEYPWGFHAVTSIISNQDLVVGDNNVNFDFVFEDLFPTPPVPSAPATYYPTLRVMFINQNTQGNWDIYSILPKVTV